MKEPMTAAEVQEHVPHLSYRQLDYWTRAGYVTAVEPDPEATGSGYLRRWPAAEVEVLDRAAALADAGVHVDCAFRIARQWAEHPLWPVYLGHGISISADSWHPDHPQTPDALQGWRDARDDRRREDLADQLLAQLGYAGPAE